MGDFYTSYDTEKGRVILQIPTDATTDDMALIQDMLNLIKAVLDKRRADTPQTNCSEKPNNSDCPWK